jgi:hypothetical protein
MYDHYSQTVEDISYALHLGWFQKPKAAADR